VAVVSRGLKESVRLGRIVVLALAAAPAVLGSCDRAAGSSAGATSALVTDPAEWRAVWAAVPPGRSSAPIAYDADRKVMVLFGGVGSRDVGSPEYADIWEWNAARATWHDRTPMAMGPAKGYDHVMIFDAARKKTFLFGGYSFAERAFRTGQWEWDGATTSWTPRVAAGAQPAARGGAAMVWDGDRRRAVLFGGDNAGWHNDLWEWDGAAGTWTDRTPAGTKPAGRAYHTMAYDPVRKRVVLYGGLFLDAQNATITLDETWEWDGAT